MSTDPTDPIVPAGMTPERAKEVRDFVAKLSGSVHELELDEGSHEELRGHIEKVEAQLGGEEHHTMIDDAILAVQRLLASSETQKATELLKEAGRFLTGVG